MAKSPSSEVAGAFQALAIELVYFEKRGASVRFDDSVLRKLMIKSRKRANGGKSVVGQNS